MNLFAILISSENYVKFLCQCIICIILFLIFGFIFLNINLLSIEYMAKIYFHFIGSLFVLIIFSFDVKMFFDLI
jgi:hypothetical protein